MRKLMLLMRTRMMPMRMRMNPLKQNLPMKVNPLMMNPKNKTMAHLNLPLMRKRMRTIKSQPKKISGAD